MSLKITHNNIVFWYFISLFINNHKISSSWELLLLQGFQSIETRQKFTSPAVSNKAIIKICWYQQKSGETHIQCCMLKVNAVNRCWSFCCGYSVDFKFIKILLVYLNTDFYRCDRLHFLLHFSVNQFTFEANLKRMERCKKSFKTN